MESLESTVERAAERFQLAALDDSWEEALESLAAACGANGAQLIGIGPRAAVPFNRSVGLDPMLLEQFAEMGGGQASLNPRVRHGVASKPLTVQTEADFDRPGDILDSPIYAGLYTPFDISFTIQAKLLGGETNVVGLSVLQPLGRGLPTEQQKAVFSALAPMAQAAVRLKLAMEGDGARMLAGAFEAAGMAAFVCDGASRVCALTPLAERLVSQQRHLRISQAQLTAAGGADIQKLRDAIWRCAYREGAIAAASQVIVRDSEGDSAIVLEVAPLPSRDFPFGLSAAVLVIARSPRNMTRLLPVLQEAYGLTAAEAEVCVAVASGDELHIIAARRGVSWQTIRNQLKRATTKLGVRRQAELAAFVNGL